MKNVFLYFILLFSVFFGYSQESQQWKGFFSYNSIKDISQSTTTIYAAAENAYFKRNIATNEVSTTSTVEGLSGENISQIYHSEAFKKTLIGHTNGLMIVVNDVDGKMQYVVDILNKASVPPNKKKINHFMEHDGKVYVSTDFGICVYDLNLLEFGDTYFIGAGGADVVISQTTVYNGFIYAVASGYGLLKAVVTNTNLIDYNQWQMASGGSWSNVVTAGSELIAASVSGSVFKFIGDNPIFLFSLPQVSIDSRYNNGYLIMTTLNHVYVFNEQLVEVQHINVIPDLTVTFTCATVINDKIYIGTQEKGVITTTLVNPIVYEIITPNGPDRNKIFSIQSFSNGLWAVYGDYDSDYNPYGLDSYGVSKYGSDNKWLTTPYSELFGAKSIVRIAVNPNNEKQVYFSSYYSGVLKFEDDIPATIYNRVNNNSSLLSIVGQVPDDIRINGSAFDKEGDLWVTNSLVSKGLHVLKSDGQWQGFNLPVLLTPASISFGRMAVDKNGTKWIATNFEGLVGFNEKFNNRCIGIHDGQDEGNLPSRDVRAVAVDKRNKVWIGTRAGLRVLQSVDSFLSQDELTTSSIIILEDGIAQELLFEQFITDIVVDGANNKWIGTAGAGVFFISPDGQKTYNIFTKENSPLPSNVIADIDINGTTGEVFIATDNGMVSYKGVSTNGSENLESVVIFPNPVRPEFNGNVAIAGLMNKCNVKITDIEGNLVYEAISEGGTMEWDTKVFGKRKVASGVYMVFISSEDGLETKVKKVMIVR